MENFNKLSLQERLKLTKKSILDELERNEHIHPVNTYLNTQYILEILKEAEEKDLYEKLYFTHYNRGKEYFDQLNDLQYRYKQIKNALKEIESMTRNPKEYEPSYYSINHIAKTALKVENSNE